MRRETLQNIEPFYDSISHLFFHELEISLVATAPAFIDGWLGAALRNNLHFASAHIITKTRRPLSEGINILLIGKTHPLYNKSEEGFPK